MSGKLSLVLGSASPAAFDFLRRVQPPVVHVVNDFSFVSEIKALSPGTRIIGRLPAGAGPEPVTGDGDPRARAREFFESRQETCRSSPGVDYWVGCNEPEVETPERMEWYAAFEAERTALLAGAGLKACLGNFATASPEELEVWPHFTPALKEGKKHGAILGLHEYSAPRMDSFFGKNQLNPAEDEGDTGWTTCRYRKIYRDYLVPARLHLPLVITEAGIDGRVLSGRRTPPAADGAPRRGGWRLFGAWWLQNGGLSNPAQEYLRQLQWYGSRLLEDQFVWGATVFHSGISRDSYSLDGDLIGPLTEACAAPGGVPPAPARSLARGPAPSTRSRLPHSPPLSRTPPPAAPDHSLQSGWSPPPRQRTFVLLPPECSLELVQAAASHYHAQRPTLSFEPDELCEQSHIPRRVIVVDPHRWPGDLQQWFAGNRPGVAFETISSSALFARTRLCP